MYRGHERQTAFEGAVKWMKCYPITHMSLTLLLAWHPFVPLIVGLARMLKQML